MPVKIYSKIEQEKHNAFIERLYKGLEISKDKETIKINDREYKDGEEITGSFTLYIDGKNYDGSVTGSILSLSGPDTSFSGSFSTDTGRYISGYEWLLKKDDKVIVRLGGEIKEASITYGPYRGPPDGTHEGYKQGEYTIDFIISYNQDSLKIEPLDFRYRWNEENERYEGKGTHMGETFNTYVKFINNDEADVTFGGTTYPYTR